MFDSGQQLAKKETAQAAAQSEKTFDTIKSKMKSDLAETAYRSWIAPVGFAGFSAGVLTLTVPSRFIRDWVRTHYADNIIALWPQDAGICRGIEFVIDDKKMLATAYTPVETANENAAEDDISSPLDARLTFANFVQGNSNALAFAAAKRIASEDVPALNPLFLQGGVGLGKTHLLQAITAMARKNFPARRIVYMSAEKFMYRFVRALRDRDTITFKDQFRAIDMLLIDDIQFICGKETTQQEFFHTFNALVDNGKQIVLSADKSPLDLDGIDARLKSRLSMGLVAEITAPDEALRLAILKTKCTNLGRQIADDVLAFLAARITASARELEGALNRLIAHAELVGRDVTVEAAEEILHDVLRASARKLTVEDIQKRVAEHYHLRVADILSPRRARPLARPRQVAMYLSKQLTENSLPDIGRKFGGRDHTTIIHGVRKIEELMASDQQLLHDVESLKKSLSK